MIAKTVIDYLQQRGIPYGVLAHAHSNCTRTTAERAGVPPDRLAKAVVFADENGYVMAVVAGNRYVSVPVLSRKLRRRLQLAGEDNFAPVFRDCERGAVPPLGPAYGMETIVDDALVGEPEIYFEAGDHEELICVSGDQFLSLLPQARYGRFSH